MLVDTNDDGVGDAREFGGRDRYDTALRLAANFGAAKGLGNVPSAFVASGESLVDSVSVSGLAGFLDAPVLLTPSGSLHGGVADFIEDYGVDTVHVLGGSGAVADSVLEDLEALANEPEVSRVAGADRYATAAAVAALLGGGAAWCGGEDAAAVLVNGGDVSLVDAMMVGPIAHRLQLPVLLTGAGELASATADFIDTEDIEHVVIVGGTDAVSADVEDAVSDAGVDTVDRIAGDSPAGTSVALAELALDGCSGDLDPVSSDTVALVHRDALPGGAAAAPVLTSTFADGALVPVLVVGDTLPASVRDYLAATPSEDAAGTKTNLGIVAIGGTGAVSQSVMDAALAAAASAGPLTVQIGGLTDTNGDRAIDANDVPAPGDATVRLYFSDDVSSAGLVSKIRDVIEINGALAMLSTTLPAHVGADLADKCTPDRVNVTFASPLEAGDTVAVVGGLKLGADSDQRTLGSASVTVPAPPPDRTRPTINAILIAGEEKGWVRFSETLDLEPVDVDLALTKDEITIRSVTEGQGVRNYSNASGAITFWKNIVAGDRVTIASGAVEDAAGNKSLQRSFTAIAPHKSPRITSVLIRNLNHSKQAVIKLPDAIMPAGSTDTISMTAKADGAAAGATGNDWSVVFDVVSTWTADEDTAVDIDVRVNSRDSTAFVRFNTGNATYGDLKAALEANSAFDALFEVELPTVAANCNKTLNTALGLDNTDRQATAAAPQTGFADRGITEVAIEVRFNGYVKTVDTAAHTELLGDILAATLDRTDDDESTDTLAEVREALNLDTVNSVVGINTGPTTVVRYEANTRNAAVLPQVRDLVTTAAGLAAVDSDPAVQEVATGYAADEGDTAVNEDKNGASQVRIGRSSNVEHAQDPNETRTRPEDPKPPRPEPDPKPPRPEPDPKS